MDTAKIFSNGNSQAVRLPKNYRFEGDLVYIKKTGGGVMLMPMDIDPWDVFEEGLNSFSEDFLLERPAQGEQHREGLFQ